ncbi:hypothetical protein HY386_01880 [Candidatus Daviesbacteria bacterium]|nr:hypothetical protein [Candidatus Daviesbacteria bacterium]
MGTDGQKRRFDPQQYQASIEQFCPRLTLWEIHRIMQGVRGIISRESGTIPAQELAREVTELIAQLNPIEAFRYGIHAIETEDPGEIFKLVESGTSYSSKEREA